MVTFTVALQKNCILSFHLVSAQLGVLTGGKNIPHRYFASVSIYSENKLNTLTNRKLIGLKVTSL